jgi:hypothetical protein
MLWYWRDVLDENSDLIKYPRIPKPKDDYIFYSFFSK